TLAVPHHPGGDEKIRATARWLTPGGPAACAAAQITRLGGTAAFAGALGDDAFAALLREALAAENIELESLVTWSGHPTPLAAIIVKPDGARSVVSHRSAPENPPPPAAQLPLARVVLADGHRPEWTDTIVAHALACRAPLVIDAGSLTAATRKLAAAADHLVASEAYARAALSDRDPAEIADWTPLGAPPDATVVVTLGERGLLWRHAGERGHLPAFTVNACDTTGAGDAFHGTYAWGLARGLALPEILHLASACGALACTRPGAWTSLATRAELERFLALTTPILTETTVSLPTYRSLSSDAHRR
ncbi:MAG: hypothetical protein RL376_675, partial [Verrucomicrobiota bacterium]